MKWKTQTIPIVTSKQFELLDITSEIENEIYDSEIKQGMCVVTVTHATSSLIINENEYGLKEDILNRILALAPETEEYQHNRIDNNARAHVIASILGSSLTLLIEEGRIVRGKWQNIFFVELNGPRSNREIMVKILGEK
jgi:secondary thiamine-phosphate synthase enzyme